MVAWRYLRSRRKEAFISVIAGFSFVGIMLGVATLIIVMAVMNGFRGELITESWESTGTWWCSRSTAARRLRGAGGPLQGVDGVSTPSRWSRARRLPPGVGGAGTGALVRGIRAEDFQSMEIVSDNIRSGDLVGFTDRRGRAIGSRMAQSLGLAPAT
jgi:lipoprotein-releasing system permease protein